MPPGPGLSFLPLDPRSPCASRKLMDKQTFCSSQTTSNTSRYAAALYRQGTHSGLLRGLSGWEGSRVRAGARRGRPEGCL